MDDLDLFGMSDDLPPAAFRWDLLHDGELVDRWHAVDLFVAWLVQRYRLHRHVPPCWYLHGALVEELSALWVGWRGVMEVADRADAWLWWHDHLARLVGRCSDLWPTGCTIDHHVDPAPIPWHRPPTVDGQPSFPPIEPTTVP